MAPKGTILGIFPRDYSNQGYTELPTFWLVASCSHSKRHGFSYLRTESFELASLLFKRPLATKRQKRLYRAAVRSLEKSS